jgi:predicted GIY-YIG superfamily endonuclease
MPYYATYPSRSAAQKREYELKRRKSARYLRWLIQQAYPDLNLL